MLRAIGGQRHTAAAPANKRHHGSDDDDENNNNDQPPAYSPPHDDSPSRSHSRIASSSSSTSSASGQRHNHNQGTNPPASDPSSIASLLRARVLSRKKVSSVSVSAPEHPQPSPARVGDVILYDGDMCHPRPAELDSPAPTPRAGLLLGATPLPVVRESSRVSELEEELQALSSERDEAQVNMIEG